MILNNIPIFSECDDYDLHELVEINNKRYNDTNDAIVLTVGHTFTRDADGKHHRLPEKPVVGKAYNLAVEYIGNINPKKVITATLEVANEYKDILKLYPRRSVELCKDGVIDVLSLLGGTRPYHDLSMTFEKGEEKSIYQYKEFENMDQNKDNLLEIMMEALTKLDLVAKVDDMSQRLAAMEATKQAAEATEELPTEVLDGDLVQVKEEEPVLNETEEEPVLNETEEEPVLNETEEEKVEPEPEEKENKEYPSGSNTTVPELEEEEEDKKNFSYNQMQEAYASKFDKLSQEQESLRKENTLLKRSLILKDLAHLYSFDYEAEIELTKDLTDDQFTRHEGIIKKSYSAVPLQRAIIEPATEMSTISKERVAEIVRYATKNGVDFATAKAKFENIV